MLAPEIPRWLRSLQFRPLLWLAAFTVAGVATGAQWTHFWGAQWRDDARLLWPLFPAICFLPASFAARKNPLGWRICLGLALFCAMTAHAARRIVAPRGDISKLVKIPPNWKAPIAPVSIEMRGLVADFPAIRDFNLSFPLECAPPFQGRIWVKAPYGSPVRVGDEIRVQMELQDLPYAGNWGERETSWRAILNGAWCRGKVKTANQIVIEKPAAALPLLRAVDRARGALLWHYNEAFARNNDLQMRPFPHATAQLMTAMVFGEGGLSEPLPRIVSDDFRMAGLSHVLVASGTQVAFLAGFLLLVGRGLGLRRWWLPALVIPLLMVYALLAGGAASIWRATLGGAVLTWALLVGRDVDGLSLWSLALLVLLLCDPMQAWSLSFQLTFAATWGLLALAPTLMYWFQNRFGMSALYEMAALTLSAQLGVLPISLYHFGTFSAAGFGANFIAVPLAGIMVFTGMIGLVFAPINGLNYWMARGMGELASSAADLPGASLQSSPVSLGWSVVCYGILLAAMAGLGEDGRAIWDSSRDWARRKWDLWRQNWRSPRPFSVLALFLIFGAAMVIWRFNDQRIKPLRVTMLDVGQGESILIQGPTGTAILLDGGALEGAERSDIGRAVIVPALAELGVSRLDAIVLSHADADHCNGLKAVAAEIPVGWVLDGPSGAGQKMDKSQLDYLAFKSALEAKNIPFVAPTPGQIIDLGGGAKLTVLAPFSPALEGTNDNAIVMRVDYGKTSFLFTGDIEVPAESRLARGETNLAATVLKVAHHGSKTSTTPLFLKEVHPSLALVSCGRYNQHKHPSPLVVERLEDTGAQVFRTDVSGAIRVECDGETCSAQTFR